MTGPELWQKLQALGFSQIEFAKTIKRTDRAVRQWIKKNPPTEVAMLVNLMIDTKSTKEDLQE